MDLTTNYLGLSLAHPFMPGASPLVDDLDTVRRLEDAGASAIVMHSLFEEQITGEHLASIYLMEVYADSYAEALSYFPKGDDYALGPDAYLEQIRKIKAAVNVPVIASLNGTTRGGWLSFASKMEEAGADALELNVYNVATDPMESGRALELRLIDVVEAVCNAVRIPISVKLSPYFSSLPALATELESAGASGLVLFNRFYQPDIDIEELEVAPKLQLSEPGELLPRLRWLAILSRCCKLSLGCSGGVHSAEGAIKAIMAGAGGVQLVSCLLKHGPEYLGTILNDAREWLSAHGYHSIDQMRGSMDLSRCPDPHAFERANYMRVLQSWRLNGGRV